MKSKLLIFIILLVFGILSKLYAASYWIIQKDTQRLLCIQIDADNVKIVESYSVIDSNTDYVVNPNDSTCWVTSAFHGQVTRYGKGHPFVIGNFGAPMALAIDAERDVLWIADGALNQIVKMKLDGTFEKRIQLSASSRDIASRADGGLWIATKYGLILLDSNGNVIKRIERKAKYLSNVPGTNEVWLVYPVTNHVMHLDGDGNVLAEGRLKSLSGIVGTKDGGCFLLGRKTAFRLNASGTLVGTLHGLKHPSLIVYQPTDESVWILQSRGRQLVQLPKELEQKEVTAILGLRGENVSIKPAAEVRWISKVGKPEEEKPIMPPETTEPSEKTEPKKEKPTLPEVKTEKEEPNKEPKNEKPPKPPEIEPKPEDKFKEKTEKPEKTEIEKKPSEESGLKEEPTDTTKPEAEKPNTETEPSTKKSEPQNKPIPEEKTEPTIIPAPPTSTLLSEPPKFENGGVVIVELHEGLSSKRVKNFSQAMGRRYVWNFGDKTYSLLLGLSVEAYNSYTNRERAKWVEMLAEGVHVTELIAKEFRKLADKNSWTAEQTANFVLSFVQCLPYTVDDVSTGIDEFPRYAIETLVAGGGDCEDTTILAGSILLVLGYDVIALNPKGHLALGIKGKFSGYYFEHNKKRYYYSETSGTGWKVGEMPEIYKGVPVTLYEIPKPNQP